MKSTIGSQSLRRGLQLLSWLGANQSEAVRLKDLVEASGLERSTAYRLVAALVEEGFAERNPETRCYALGLQAMQLGLTAMHRAPLVEKCRAPMRRLARLSGDTVFLVVRQGDYALCLHREEGSFPIKALTTDVGKRRLLGVGAAGCAILAQMSDVEVGLLYARRATEFKAFHIDVASLRVDLREGRRQGYSVMQDTITTGVAGVGCAFRPALNILAGISIAAIGSRVDPARQRDLSALLQGECAQLEGAVPSNLSSQLDAETESPTWSAQGEQASKS